jgi:ethanolamine utilization microcompartment shell protein EutL
MSADIKHARQLLDHLAPDQVAAVVHVMEVMLAPVSRALADAPAEDEEISAEEEQSVAEARVWLKHNPGIPFEQVVAELGLTMEEVRNYQAGLNDH